MAGLTPLAQTARRRPKPAGDEEASSVLKLGEMSNSAALSTAAAHELLLKIEEARGKDPNLPLTHNDLITKNNTYLEVFARFKGSDTVQQVTSEAETLTQLAEFERAQLGEFFFVLCWDRDGLLVFLSWWWMAGGGFGRVKSCGLELNTSTTGTGDHLESTQADPCEIYRFALLRHSRGSAHADPIAGRQDHRRRLAGGAGQHLQAARVRLSEFHLLRNGMTNVEQNAAAASSSKETEEQQR
jgi:DNA-directed RNA polymerase II subunit RPB4